MLESSRRGFPQPVDQKIGDYYASCGRTPIEKASLAPLKQELDRIEALKNVRDLAPLVARPMSCGRPRCSASPRRRT
jgi:predicted metalloendopeptidase